jgi:hypothetical protein
MIATRTKLMFILNIIFSVFMIYLNFFTVGLLLLSGAISSLILSFAESKYNEQDIKIIHQKSGYFSHLISIVLIFLALLVNHYKDIYSGLYFTILLISTILLMPIIILIIISKRR